MSVDLDEVPVLVSVGRLTFGFVLCDDMMLIRFLACNCQSTSLKGFGVCTVSASSGQKAVPCLSAVLQPIPSTARLYIPSRTLAISCDALPGRSIAEPALTEPKHIPRLKRRSTLWLLHYGLDVGD